MNQAPSNTSTRPCCICQEPAELLILCEKCAAAALRVSDMVPGQISIGAQGDLDACLVDAWGRIFGLSPETELGREGAGGGIAIHQASISRRHAILKQEPDGGFCLRDLKSTNGTQVGHLMLDDNAAALASGDLIYLGSVGFYFLSPRPSMQSANVEFSTLSAASDSGEGDLYKEAEPTDLNDLESVEIEVIEATGGGGGFVDVAGTKIQLSMVQLELMKLLLKRMNRDRARPSAVRGYLHSSEILAEVSWDTAHPSDNHVKQLVRRLRRSLARSGRDDLVQSQQGLGYRLSVRPVATSTSS